MTVRVEHGDCLEVIPRLADEGVVVDAIVTDPPYHLTSGNIAVDYSAYGPRTDGGSNRGITNKAGRKVGFMGQTWDGGDLAFRPETWATIGSVLKPGGFLLAFGGTRTWHRLACAIEDAGFVLQDTLMWLYGSGFPKNKAHLKPAYEPIIMAYKPGGARTLQVDECRIGTERVWEYPNGPKGNTDTSQIYGGGRGLPRREMPLVGSAGRWPANVCHDGSDDVVALFPESGSAGHHPARRGSAGLWSGEGGGLNGNSGSDILMDTGSAARFFYQAKASKVDRADSKHPTIKPVALTEWLVRLVTPPNGRVLDAFAGTGVTGQAATQTGRNAILIELDAQSIVDIRHRLKMWTNACLIPDAWSIPARPRLQRPGPIPDRPRLRRPA